MCLLLPLLTRPKQWQMKTYMKPLCLLNLVSVVLFCTWRCSRAACPIPMAQGLPGAGPSYIIMLFMHLMQMIYGLGFKRLQAGPLQQF